MTMSRSDMIEMFEDVDKPISNDTDLALRVHLIKKQLTLRTDLTTKQRKQLLQRKNYCTYRMRRLNEKMISQLYEVLLPTTEKLVSKTKIALYLNISYALPLTFELISDFFLLSI